jgi:hypothetical protein
MHDFGGREAAGLLNVDVCLINGPTDIHHNPPRLMAREKFLSPAPVNLDCNDGGAYFRSRAA